MKDLAAERMFGRGKTAERYAGANAMQLCTYSQSEYYRQAILSGCPLGLKASERNLCSCRKRLYHQGPLDLRVLSCCFPKTWQDRQIHDPEAFARALRASKKPSTNNSNNKKEKEPMTEAKTEHETPVEGTASVPVVASTGGQLAFYAKIADPMDAVNKLGQAFAGSKMFGCSNESQGRVLAMHCLSEGKSPVALMTEYHLIGGNLSMKADVMLARFRKAGGSHVVIERSAERAAIELKMKRQSQTFEFTWEEAKAESYVYAKDGKTLKDNWSTPRRRMQMLWARCISDAVRVMCPEAVAGHYTPEDLGVTSDPGEVIDAEFTVVPDAPAATHEHQWTVDNTNSDEWIKSCPCGATERVPRPKSEPAKPAEPTPESPAETAAEPGEPIDAEFNVTREQLVEMAGLKKELGYGDDVWKRVLDKFEVTTAKNLSSEDADRVLDWLKARKQKAASGNPHQEWADKAAQ